jgi:glutaconate CoA-transferase subunit B
MTMSDYSPSEFMIAAAARALEGKKTVFVGVGLPGVACNLARHTVAPNIQMVYESGVVGARPARSPLSIGDPTLVSGALLCCSQADLFMYYLQAGRIEVAFLGAAQIDRYGNLNSTVIGSYDEPKVRLPGSGGACEIAAHAQDVFLIMRLKKRAFVETLDFQTSPGHLGGGSERSALDLPGSGPRILVSDMGVFVFDNISGEMTLQRIRPGVTVEMVQAEVGWPLKVAVDLRDEEPPSPEELRIIREELASGSGQVE